MQALTAFACLIIIAIVAIIIGNIVFNGFEQAFLGISVRTAEGAFHQGRHFPRHFRHRRPGDSHDHRGDSAWRCHRGLHA